MNWGIGEVLFVIYAFVTRLPIHLPTYLSVHQVFYLPPTSPLTHPRVSLTPLTPNFSYLFDNLRYIDYN